MKLVTYNIRGGLGMDNRRSIERICDVLREINADIICLQEVHNGLPYSAFQKQPSKIAKALNLEYVFQNNWRGGVGKYGNLILSRLPILKSLTHQVINTEERKIMLSLRLERRGVLEVVFPIENRNYHILTTHWSLNEQDRVESVHWLCKYLKSLTNPVILTGDFNAAAISEEMQLMREEGGLIDAGMEGNALTFPSINPTTRIDYVYHTSDVKIKSLSVINTQVSDHLPVVVEFDECFT